MTFALLDLGFLAAATVTALLLLRRRRRSAWVTPFVVTMVGLVALTLVFDNLMIAADLFDYGVVHRTGILIGQAPVEDLAYPLGGAILLPAVWAALTRGPRR